jgi:hypothetical protein
VKSNRESLSLNNPVNPVGISVLSARDGPHVFDDYVEVHDF